MWRVILLVAAGWAIWEFQLDPVSNEITAHLEIREISGDWKHDTRIRFTVIPESQTVVARFDTKPPFLEALRDCLVADRKNWNCGEFGIVDGGWMTHQSRRIVSPTTWWLKNLGKS